MTAATARAERIELLDVLRGFALLGILLVKAEDWVKADCCKPQLGNHG